MDGHRKTLETLQVGRAFAALCVVAFHVNAMLALPEYLGHEVFPWFRAGKSGVDFFFVLSGFVILLAHGKDIGRARACVPFLWKRFRRIYPPLWAVLLLVLPVFFFVPWFGHGGETRPLTIVNAFLIAPAQSERLLSVEWTLRHEVVFYLVFAVVVLRPAWGLLLGAIWLSLSALDPLFDLNNFGEFLFSGYHVLFGFGLIACLAYRSDVTPAPGLVLLAGLALFALAWFLACRGAPVDSIPLIWLFGLGSALAILGAACLERRRGFGLPFGLVLLGEASYSIYLLHFPAVSLLGKLSRSLYGRVPDTALAAAIGLGAVAAGLVFYAVVERRLLALFSWRAVRPTVEPPDLSVSR